MDEVEKMARVLARKSFLMRTDFSDAVIEHAEPWADEHWREFVEDARQSLDDPA